MTKNVAGTFVGTLAAGVLIILAARFLGPIPLSISQTTTNKQSTFDVTGNGEVTSSPDRAEITVGVQTSEPSVQVAQEKGNQIIKKITDDVVSLGVEKSDIKTINYSLYPNYDYRTGNQKITGYALNVSLQIKIKDFSKINQVVDSATRNGANQVGGVNFTLSEDKQRELETQVREQAITRAKEKAETLSKLAGVRLGKIVNVSENNQNGGPTPILMYAKDAAVGAGGGSSAPTTNVEPGSTTFSMSVTLSYETL